MPNSHPIVDSPRGSAYAAYKQGFIELLKVRPKIVQEKVLVSYQSPIKTSDIRTSEGKFEAIHFDDSGSGLGPTTGDYNQDNEIICALPLRITETIPIPLLIQVMLPGTGTQADQRAADVRVDELLYEIMSVIAHNPTVGLEGAPGVDYAYASRAYMAERRTGKLGENLGRGHGASCRLYIELKARLTYYPDAV